MAEFPNSIAQQSRIAIFLGCGILLQAARENKVRHPTRKSRFSLKIAGFPDLIFSRTLFSSGPYFFPDLILISGHPRKLASRAGCGAGRADQREIVLPGRFPDLILFRTLFFSGPYFLFWPPSEAGSPAGCGAGRAHQREIVLPHGFPDLIFSRTLFSSGPHFHFEPPSVLAAARRRQIS